MSEFYTGYIVEESLTDNRILNTLTIAKVRIGSNVNPAKRWHLYTVNVTPEQVKELSGFINGHQWYINFWRDQQIIAVFRDKTFEFSATDKSTWAPAVAHGLKLGIPAEQLDFPIRSFLYGTGNPAKLQSMAKMLQGLPVCILGLAQVGLTLPDVQETGSGPVENARLKALAYHAAWRRPVFSCDSGLFFDGVAESEQPGTRVRTVGGRRLSDEEMLAHYMALAARHGGLLRAQYHNDICLIDENDCVHQTCEEALRSAVFGLSAAPHPRRDPGFPLDALSVHLTTGKYFYDLGDAVRFNQTCSHGLGFRRFFQALE
jgi:8-oxo-dGTP diphosphatase